MYLARRDLPKVRQSGRIYPWDFARLIDAAAASGSATRGLGRMRTDQLQLPQKQNAPPFLTACRHDMLSCHSWGFAAMTVHEIVTFILRA